jgi:TM2 domain-containing membrane protein YozV
MKSKGTAYLLWFFLGLLGVHRFYLGKTGTGILYLFSLGLCGIGWLVDLFTLGSQVDAYNALHFRNGTETQVNEAVSYNQPTTHVKTVWDTKVENEAQRLAGLIRTKEDFSDFLDALHIAEKEMVYPTSNKGKIQKEGELDVYNRVRGIIEERIASTGSVGDDFFNDIIEDIRLPEVEAEITYCDQSDNRTNRKITMRRLKTRSSGERYLEAFCELRNDYRTFKVSGIEFLKVGEEDRKPREFIEEIRKQSADYKLSSISEEHRDELAIFVFIAKIDMHFTKPERLIIAGYFKNVMNIDFPPDEIRSDDVPLKTFYESVKVINKWDGEKRSKLKSYLVALAKIDSNLLKDGGVALVEGESMGEAMPLFMA